ncbi:hypothetical protein C5G87_06950 [Paenibacillus peoriae]|uniref:hypothetical protein n=1 Tax=Paenibacillus peoriae TaxID=59893 RepID=UPI000CEBC597|nr:hypothetical protein [Paenibacillus peoriae]PPQ49106.1 hypothetical protein C5G87_06950 [Paenibacillus peoriae]
MKMAIAYKFKNGMTATTEGFDVYDWSKQENGDLLKLIIKGKLDNQNIDLDGKIYKYNDVKSIELIFQD